MLHCVVARWTLGWTVGAVGQWVPLDNELDSGLDTGLDSGLDSGLWALSSGLSLGRPPDEADTGAFVWTWTVSI